MFSAISAIATLTRSGNAGASTGRLWLLFFTAVPLCWCSWWNARHLPHTRQVSSEGPPPQVLRDPGQPPYKLASYQLAHRELLPSVTHRRSKYLNNRAENSHQPTRVRERVMKRFASPGQGQRFLFAFGSIRQHFRPRRHLISAPEWRTEMTNRFAVWNQITAAAA